MKKSIGQASGKIILSGEYAVVFGYPGIAVPCSCLGHTTGAVSRSVLSTATGAVPAPFTVTAKWESVCHPERSRRATHGVPWFDYAHHDTLTITHHGIENEDHLHHILEEIQKYTGPCLSGRQALSGHLTIENTIPIGRGMGSSTALVIAICRCLWKCGTFFPPPKGKGTGEGYIKQIALSIEDAVNPGHSGLDFEVIWNEKPILFRKGSPPKTLNVTINQLIVTPYQFCLIDTGKPAETTAELVAWIKKKVGFPSPSGEGSTIRSRAHGREGRGGKRNIYRPPLSSSLPTGERTRALQTIGHCTERLIAGESPLIVFSDHHRAQVALGVVPELVQKLIADIEQTGGAAKVIGAGGRISGGGMVFALHQKRSTLTNLAKKHGFQLTTRIAKTSIAAWQSG